MHESNTAAAIPPSRALLFEQALVAECESLYVSEVEAAHKARLKRLIEIRNQFEAKAKSEAHHFKKGKGSSPAHRD